MQLLVECILPPILGYQLNLPRSQEGSGWKLFDDTCSLHKKSCFARELWPRVDDYSFKLEHNESNRVEDDDIIAGEHDDMIQYDDLIQHTFAIAGEHDDRLQSVDLRWTKHPLEL